MKRLILLVLLVLGGLSPGRAFPPYYDIADCATAEAEATQRHLPLAWLGDYPQDLKSSNMQNVDALATPTAPESEELTQMALDTLEDKAVIICFDGGNMSPVPAIVHAQDHIPDDGPLDGVAAWKPPKIVFTNPDVSRILGRVSHTQMAADGSTSITNVLRSISPASLAPEPAASPSEPAAAAVLLDPPPTDTSTNSATRTSPATSDGFLSTLGLGDPNDDGADDMSSDELVVWVWLKQNGIYVGIALAVVLLALRAASRPAA